MRPVLACSAIAVVSLAPMLKGCGTGLEDLPAPPDAELQASIVAARYMATGVNGVEQFNVYGLIVGESAVVDRCYVDMALRLSSDAVCGIADWGGRQPEAT